MSTITSTSASTSTASSTAPRLWRAALGYGVAAAAATTTVAAVAHGAGVSLDVSGEPIPVAAFAQMTLLFTLVGFGIAVGLRRWTHDARTAWIRTTVVLTTLSFVPDLLADAATGTRLTLMATHLVAALVVVPGIASRLPRR
ncbi:MAG: DUF6069 family protein [Marmoricola sp.]